MELLSNVPDFTSWKEASDWLEEGKRVARQLVPGAILQADMASLEWDDIAQKQEAPFGLYASDKWRKFVLATFLADLVAYPKSSDQVNFERLLYVMHAFPRGFRTWWHKVPDGSWWPMGYTGWYPMLETAFQLFENNPGELKDRMVVPNTHITEQAPYLYLFNFSAAVALKKSNFTQALMQRFVEDISAQKPAGLACITVSEDGMRIANRFGMTRSGAITVDGESEGVFTFRAHPSQTPERL